MAIDPVCEQEVDEAQARLADLTVRYAKQVFSFCCARCKHEFEDCPDEYVGRTGARRGAWPGLGGMDGYVEVVRRVQG